MAQTPSRRRVLSATALDPVAALFSVQGASAKPSQRTLRSFDFTPYHREAAEPDDDNSAEFWAKVDAELIEHCDRAVAARAEFLRLYCGKAAPADPDNHPVIGPRLVELDAIECDTLTQLRGMRAQSIACAEAMARVALVFAERDADWQVPEEYRSWPAMAAVEWLAGDDFYHWAATHPVDRADDPPPPVRRAVT